MSQENRYSSDTAAVRGDGLVVNSDSLSFLEDIWRLIIDDAIIKGTDRRTKVVEFLHPEELKARLDLRIDDEGADRSVLIEICRSVVKYSVHTDHPRHFNLLFSGLDTSALAGALLTEALNANLHTFEAAPVFVIVENYIVDQLSRLIGFPNGDGVFVPGSSFGNFLAIHLARFRHFGEDVRKKGLFGLPRMYIFCSIEAHYSMTKAAPFLGFGTDSIKYIETSDDGYMKSDQLETSIIDCKQTGGVPLIVMATCGTTVIGGFDRLTELADICERHDVWLHADAAWGGGALFSKHHRHLVEGIERCDSVVWSLHKLMGARVQCASLIVKEKGLLEKCNSTGATYLFARDKFYDTSYDIGDKTVQCGRKVDSLKFWMMWKSLGNTGMAHHVDKAIDNAKYFTEKLKQREGFKLVRPNFVYANVCFWYVPARLRNQEETKDWWREIGEVTPKIKEGMMIAGSTLIGYQPLESKKLVNFFRIIVGNACSVKADLDFVINEIDRIGRDL